MTIRTLIVDDEPLGRKRVHKLLETQTDIEIIGEGRDGREAVRLIEAHTPDLVFLDIQMPEVNGFEALAQLGKTKLPVVVFITAHDEFAVKAFEAQALDYLLKPFDDERFLQALTRARLFLNQSGGDAFTKRLEALVSSLPAQKNYLSRIAVESEERVVFLKIADVDWIEAQGNYVNFHVSGQTHLLRGRLSELEKKLDPNQFFRIHRSSLVNLDRVREFLPMFKGEGLVVLKDGQRLQASRSCSQRLHELLQPEL